ncbi:MAG: hypothetical protein WCO66_01725 [Candidatus Absconditabacteria bacterium]
MFYLGRSYMLNTQKHFSRYKIGSLAVLLGLFGFFGTSVFAALGASCSATNTKQGDSWEGHVYTCEQYATTNSACDTKGKVQKCVTPEAADSCSLSCCICTKPNDVVNGGIVGNEVKTPEPSQAEKDRIACEARITNKEDVQWNSSSNKCENCKDDGVCCGVKLNTNVPFVGKCIRTGEGVDSSDTTVVTSTTAFPRLMGALTKIMTTFILLICFGGILVGGVMIASSGGETGRASDGKKLIGKVIVAIALLGTSGIILHLINPNFFG